MDAKGIHGLSCIYSAGRHPRQASLNDVVRRALKSAGIPSILELVGIDKRNSNRPDGFSVFRFRMESVSVGIPHAWIPTLRQTLIVQL